MEKSEMHNKNMQDAGAAVDKFSCRTSYANGGMLISRKWFNTLDFVGVLVLAVVFNGVWIANDFLDILLGDRELLLRLFALLFIGIGIAMVYCCVANLVNTTTIKIDQQSISVKHKPVPWPGNTDIERSIVEKLALEEKHHLGSSKQRPKVSFRILAITANLEYQAGDGNLSRI